MQNIRAATRSIALIVPLVKRICALRPPNAVLDVQKVGLRPRLQLPSDWVSFRPWHHHILNFAFFVLTSRLILGKFSLHMILLPGPFAIDFHLLELTGFFVLHANLSVMKFGKGRRGQFVVSEAALSIVIEHVFSNLLVLDLSQAVILLEFLHFIAFLCLLNEMTAQFGIRVNHDWLALEVVLVLRLIHRMDDLEAICLSISGLL